MLLKNSAVVLMSCTACARASSAGLFDGSNDRSSASPHAPQAPLRSRSHAMDGTISYRRGLDDAPVRLARMLQRRAQYGDSRLRARKDVSHGNDDHQKEPKHDAKPPDNGDDKGKDEDEKEKKHEDKDAEKKERAREKHPDAGDAGIGGSTGALRIQDQMAGPQTEVVSEPQEEQAEEKPEPQEDQAGEETTPGTDSESEDPDAEDAPDSVTEMQIGSEFGDFDIGEDFDQTDDADDAGDPGDAGDAGDGGDIGDAGD